MSYVHCRGDELQGEVDCFAVCKGTSILIQCFHCLTALVKLRVAFKLLNVVVRADRVSL